MAWCNHHLEKRGLHVTDISKDFSDGVMLINLVEIVSGASVGRYVQNPRFPAQKMANITEALNFMERVLGVKVVGCNARGMPGDTLKITQLEVQRVLALLYFIFGISQLHRRLI